MALVLPEHRSSGPRGPRSSIKSCFASGVAEIGGLTGDREMVLPPLGLTGDRGLVGVLPPRTGDRKKAVVVRGGTAARPRPLIGKARQESRRGGAATVAVRHRPPLLTSGATSAEGAAPQRTEGKIGPLGAIMLLGKTTPRTSSTEEVALDAAHHRRGGELAPKIRRATRMRPLCGEGVARQKTSPQKTSARRCSSAPARLLLRAVRPLCLRKLLRVLQRNRCFRQRTSCSRRWRLRPRKRIGRRRG